MWCSLAVLVSLAAASVVSAESTILGCLSSNHASQLALVKAGTSDECAISCLGEDAWFSAYEKSSSSCRCSKIIPSSMVRGSEGCRGAGSVISVIRPALLSSLVKPSQAKRITPAPKSRQDRQAGLCPTGLTACNAPQVEGYQCIDVSSDPNSCGACLNGEFGVSPVVKGPDCKSMPGVHRDAVLCVAGSCLATACQAGYQLVADGTCFWL